MASDKTQRLAGEYVLGTLDPSERARAERLREIDPDFARSVAEWEWRLAPLSEAVEPVQPDLAVWSRIEAALDAGAAAPQERGSRIVAQLVQLRQHLVAWRLTAFATAAAAVIAGVLWLGGVDSPWVSREAAEQYVAMLADEAGEVGYVVTVEPSARRMMVRDMGVRPPPEKSYEMWIMMPDKQEPLGLVQPEKNTMPLPETIRTAQLDLKTKVIVCLEPEGGRQPGAAMGPVVYSGKLMRQTP